MSGVFTFLVQSSFTNSNTSLATASVGPIDTTGAGLIILTSSGHSDNGAGSATFTDSESNVWTAITNQGNGSDPIVTGYYCSAPITSTSHTFNGAANTGADSAATLNTIYVAAFGGVASATLDHYTSNGQGGSPGSTSLQVDGIGITPTGPNELAIAGFAIGGELEGGSTPTGLAVNDGFTGTIIDSTAFGKGGGLTYVIQTTATPIDPTWTWTNISTACGYTACFIPGASDEVATITTSLGGLAQIIDVTPGLPSSVSINRAWSYVQDGHTFYVIDLGTQGTYAYDTSTQQWNELQTDGTNWNMTNGVMWGQRVVAGDHVTGDVWELDPGAVTDAGGAYEIDHVVTGVVSLRGRTFVSCDAVRVAASAGVVADSGAVMNLRFSDDDGQTWSDYYPITLTEGHTYQDLAWRSLGSFRSPGRIFEFSDSGGLIRIDGADAYLDGFDNDGSAQPPPGKP